MLLNRNLIRSSRFGNWLKCSSGNGVPDVFYWYFPSASWKFYVGLCRYQIFAKTEMHFLVCLHQGEKCRDGLGSAERLLPDASMILMFLFSFSPTCAYIPHTKIHTYKKAWKCVCGPILKCIPRSASKRMNGCILYLKSRRTVIARLIVIINHLNLRNLWKQYMYHPGMLNSRRI